MRAIIADNIARVRQNIEHAAERAGRDPGGITIVAVTKTWPAQIVSAVIEAGINVLGENRVQEAKRKAAELPGSVRWHMVGHLQSNKAKDAARIFDCVHSIDSDRIATELNRRLEAVGRRMDVLIEVNLSGEEQKYGVCETDVRALIDHIRGLDRLMPIGLMTMAPLVGDAEQTRPVFRRLRELREELESSGVEGLRELSMGMSQDYRVAVEEGATIVRIGSAIFKGCRRG